MRPGAGFNATATAVAAAMVTTPSTSSGVHSAWHSPVPYLFGGLAAMLGLIAFALLILACSYWKLSGYLEGANNRNSEGDVASEKPVAPPVVPHVCYEEKIVVIMAGDEKPTFLATPMSSRNSSFGDKSTNNNDSDEKNDKKNEETKIVVGDEQSVDSQKEGCESSTRDHQESSHRENLEEV